MVELLLTTLRLHVTGGLEDAVPDVEELVVASVHVQVWVEHTYVHRLPDASLVLVCFTIQYPYIVSRDLVFLSTLEMQVL